MSGFYDSGWPALAGAWIAALWRASWQGGLFILAVWLLCRWAPRLPAAARCWLWWLAGAKLLVGLAWLEPLPLPLLPAAPAAGPAPVSAAGAFRVAFPGQRPPPPPGAFTLTPFPFPPAPHPRPAPPALPTAPLLLLAWLVGLGFRLRRSLCELAAARRLRAGARPVLDPVVLVEVARLARRIGLRPPAVLESPTAPGPLVIGPFRPVVLLPVGLADSLSGGELRLALAHELAHLRRRDLLLGLVPGLALACFFFHPLAWLAFREWATAREAACDAEALRGAGGSATEYGRLLLRLAASSMAPQGGGRPALGLLGATASYHTLKRRLKMLERLSSSPSPAPGPARGARRRLLRAGCFLLGAVGAMAVFPWRVTAQGEAVPGRGARVAEQWEDVLLLEALRALRLSPGQLRQVLPLARAADERLEKLHAQEERTLAALERIAQESRAALLAGRASSAQGQTDAIAHRGSLQQRRAQAEEEILQHVTPRFARILLRDQLVRALLLAAGEAPPNEAKSPALLDPSAGFALAAPQRQEWRDSAIRRVLARRYPPQVLNALPMDRVFTFVTFEGAVGDRSPGPESRDFVLEARVQSGDEVRVTRGLITQPLPPGAGPTVLPSPPSPLNAAPTDPRVAAARKEREGLEGRLDQLAGQLVDGANLDDLLAALRPLARRLFLSPRFTPVLEERLGER